MRRLIFVYSSLSVTLTTTALIYYGATMHAAFQLGDPQLYKPHNWLDQTAAVDH
jgi:hypothetical protein